MIVYPGVVLGTQPTSVRLQEQRKDGWFRLGEGSSFCAVSMTLPWVSEDWGVWLADTEGQSAQWSHCIPLWLGGYKSWALSIPMRARGPVGNKQLLCYEKGAKLDLEHLGGEGTNFFTVSICAFPRTMPLPHNSCWRHSPTSDTLESLPAHFAAHHKDSVEAYE